MAEEPTTNKGTGPAARTADPVVVVGEFVVVDGCKVARVEPGGVLAFPDKCRGRSQRRGCDQVRVKVADLARAVQDTEASG